MSISIGTQNYYDLASTLSATESTKTTSLESTLNNMSTDETTDEELMDVCKDFEAYFIEQVYKEMKKTVHSSDDDNDYMQCFGDMLVEEYASSTVENGSLGIAQLLYDSMKRNS